jgi:hypothetical protein
MEKIVLVHDNLFSRFIKRAIFTDKGNNLKKVKLEDIDFIIANIVSSKKNTAGIDLAISRARPHWKELIDLWGLRASARGTESFFKKIFDLVCAVDSIELRVKGDVLRTENRTISTSSGEAVEINLAALLITEVILALCNGDHELFFKIINEAVEDGNNIWQIRFLLNIVLGNFLLERKEYDKAIILARNNLSTVPGCRTSQDLLWKVLKEKNDAGLQVEKPEIPLTDLTDRFCDQPFRFLTTAAGRTRDPSTSPAVHACQCALWLPYDLNADDDDQNFENVWNGEKIQEIRRSILDGDYKYCSRMLCPSISYDTLPKKEDISEPDLRDIIDNHKTRIDIKPKNIFLGHDGSCNIACPSCRTSIFVVNRERQDTLDKFAEQIIIPGLGEHETMLLISGDGDPFSSNHYRRLVRSINPKVHSGAKIVFLTNGLLMTPKEWDSLAELHPLILSIGVTVDAATKETYEDVRRPGKWETITANMEFIRNLRLKGELPSFSANFVIQQKNFEEVHDFVELAQDHWKVDHIRFLKLINFGTFSQEQFEENDVADPRHPQYKRFCEIMRHPNLSRPNIDMWMPRVDVEEITGSEAHSWSKL